jgi:hypothetical protein
MTTVTESGAVSWGAVIAGAVGAAALSLVLFVLGSGLGLAVVSPWSHAGASATAVGVGTIVWVTIVQLLASALGGYLAGRLRSRWIQTHTNEVYFRDTAHGFLAWAVSTLLMATLLSSALTGLVTGGTKAGAALAGTAASMDSYTVDSLLRSPTANANEPDKAPEVGRILANALKDGELNDADQRYLAQVVAARIGVSQSEATTRVQATFQEMKQTADEARKASAWLALWLVVSLFVGAFVASWCATFGGRLRDSAVLATA